jgi:hypothetical protein
MDASETALPYGGRRCQARSKQSGDQCRRAASPGRNVCYIHGGATPQGPAASRFKHGRYSKALPQGLRKSFEEYLASPDPLSLLENVAVADARVVELLSRLEHADWPKVKKVWETTKEAASKGDLAGVTAGMAELDVVFQANAKNDDVWEQIQQVQEHKGELAAREWKRRVDMKQVISVEQLLLLVSAITSVIIEGVTLREDRLRVLRGIERLLSLGHQADAGRPVSVGCGDDPEP